MPPELALWRIENGPVRLQPSGMPTEERLEELIEKDPGILGERLLIVGRQVRTDFGGRIDLLAIDDDGDLHVLELKKDRTPREVVAQALDYGFKVNTLSNDDVRRLYEEYGKGNSTLDEDYESTFGYPPPEDINSAHTLTVVAAEVDPATERIVEYVASFAVPINVLFFRYFEDENRQYLARTFLLDQEQATTAPAKSSTGKTKEPWNGLDWYVSFGEFMGGRSWADGRQYGFVSAGGKDWYSRTLRKLPVGGRVFAYLPGVGYVGVGTVTGPASLFERAVVSVDGVPRQLSELDLAGTYFHANGEPEWVVPVSWLMTRAQDDAFKKPGLFANQNSAARLRNKFTLDQLYKEFEIDSEAATASKLR